MTAGSTLDIIFDESTAVRLHSPSKKSPDAYVKLASKWKFCADATPVGPTQGALNVSQVYHATLETYQSPVARSRADPIEVAVKWVRGSLGVEKMRYEAALYKGKLKHLQGDVVPRCYGFFTGEVDGEVSGCLVLERCNNSYSLKREELNRRRMSAIYRLHAEGIVHGQLRDAGHFLYSQDGRVRIVDFSTAQLHHCPNHWDGSAFERGPSPEPCEEVSTMEVCLGICSAGGWAIQGY
ncbi:uncharacterized protein B0H18DRAFT_1206218 [Fomitopsis serialis]|uniref:uncharacterized protein n=1 Tax=Fomitopsis serialis TaxID=139415 RepID=UPI002007208B|nr:uncharacterized protein B0H18DRAFT_1206218 [Neoantrodia serialis]KAH9937354.1 hypothetical protein B0H18DRAFT_1206218 [Neoantrodia serialis]